MKVAILVFTLLVGVVCSAMNTTAVHGNTTEVHGNKTQHNIKQRSLSSLPSLSDIFGIKDDFFGGLFDSSDDKKPLHKPMKGQRPYAPYRPTEYGNAPYPTPSYQRPMRPYTKPYPKPYPKPYVPQVPQVPPIRIEVVMPTPAPYSAPVSGAYAAPAAPAIPAAPAPAPYVAPAIPAAPAPAPYVAPAIPAAPASAPYIAPAAPATPTLAPYAAPAPAPAPAPYVPPTSAPYMAPAPASYSMPAPPRPSYQPMPQSSSGYRSGDDMSNMDMDPMTF